MRLLLAGQERRAKVHPKEEDTMNQGKLTVDLVGSSFQPTNLTTRAWTSLSIIKSSSRDSLPRGEMPELVGNRISRGGDVQGCDSEEAYVDSANDGFLHVRLTA
jgi:hypothetical protein